MTQRGTVLVRGTIKMVVPRLRTSPPEIVTIQAAESHSLGPGFLTIRVSQLMDYESGPIFYSYWCLYQTRVRYKSPLELRQMAKERKVEGGGALSSFPILIVRQRERDR